MSHSARCRFARLWQQKLKDQTFSSNPSACSLPASLAGDWGKVRREEGTGKRVTSCSIVYTDP